MYAKDKSTSAISLGLTTAMVAVLLSGCATGSTSHADVSASATTQTLAAGQNSPEVTREIAHAITLAETSVLADPLNAESRMALGDAYLDGGRFASAEVTFGDAMALGDNSARAALSLALAQIAQEKYAAAATLLNDWDGEIARADLGLALSLAGQPERGIHIMSNAIRGGENTVKMRQNLAYAFAMAGRWREARLMAQQDLPAGEVNARMETWASLSSAGAYQHRVANLLQVPVNVTDEGQPVQLALANNPTGQQMAFDTRSTSAPVNPNTELAALSDLKAPPVRAAVPVAAPQPALTMPALTQTLDMPLPSEQSTVVQTVAAPSADRPTSFAAAFSAPEPLAPITAVSAPATAPQPAPATSFAAATTRESTHFVTTPAVQENSPQLTQSAEQSASFAAGEGSHLIQLGSFSSEAGAQRAWTIYVGRFPELASHERVITQAIVRGKRYWRVSAGGFDNGGSRAMCGQVSSASSDGCISWAAASPLPGAIETSVHLARR